MAKRSKDYSLRINDPEILKKLKVEIRNQLSGIMNQTNFLKCDIISLISILNQGICLLGIINEIEKQEKFQMQTQSFPLRVTLDEFAYLLLTGKVSLQKLNIQVFTSI